jgi:osmotically-inducible protein OsmY
MKLNILGVATLTALSLVCGCNKPSNSDTASSDTSGATSQTRDESSNLRATSRDSNAPSRTYSDSTKGADTTTASAREADNTGKNVRDRDDQTLTPGDQGNSESDREITRQIRRAITANDSLSTTAKNIKIITVDGKVTLRGPVKNAQEQAAIETATKGVTGVSSVDNQLEVKTANQ